MQLSNVAGPETDREMYSIAKEEHTECVSALERLRLDLTGLLLPRYAYASPSDSSENVRYSRYRSS